MVIFLLFLYKIVVLVIFLLFQENYHYTYMVIFLLFLCKIVILVIFLFFSKNYHYTYMVIFLLFRLSSGPYFSYRSYFFELLLLFQENALLSLLFHSKMSSTCKNPENFPRSLRCLAFYKLAAMFIQGVHRLTPQFLMFNLKVSLFG